jgi:hypothetical protein
VLRMEADRWAKIHKVLMWVGSWEIRSPQFFVGQGR